MSDDLSQILKAGDLLIVETGEYSDRNRNGPVRMLVTATKQELVDSFKKKWRKADFGSWRDDPDWEEFLPWLIKTTRAEAIDCQSWHVGSYGRFEPQETILMPDQKDLDADILEVKRKHYGPCPSWKGHADDISVALLLIGGVVLGFWIGFFVCVVLEHINR